MKKLLDKVLLTKPDGTYDTTGNIVLALLFTPFVILIAIALVVLFGDVICRWVALILNLFN